MSAEKPFDTESTKQKLLLKRKVKINEMNDFFGVSVDKSSETVYDRCINTNGGGDLNSKELLRIALKETGTTQAEVAERIGWTKQQLSGRISRNSLRADELLELLDALGVNVTLVIRDTGKAINRHLKGYGRRVKETVDGVPYDTEYSSAIANSFYADGINEYTDGKATELYVDSKSRYFFAEYYSWEGARDRIVPVSAEIAAQFIEKYGTEIDKKPRQD